MKKKLKNFLEILNFNKTTEPNDICEVCNLGVYEEWKTPTITKEQAKNLLKLKDFFNEK